MSALIPEMDEPQIFKPCPFCRSLDVETMLHAAQYVVQCNECGIEGPGFGTPEGARVFWNIRNRGEFKRLEAKIVAEALARA